MKGIYVLTLYLITVLTIKGQQPFYEQNANVNLYAFIGQKISVTEFEQELYEEYIVMSNGDTAKTVRIPFDQGFIAKYKVISNVFNKLNSETIEFKVFDHYGRPEFEKSKFVLLYLSYSEGDSTFYHQKYQFDEVKKSKGKWLGKNGKSIEELFEDKKTGVFKSRGIF